MNLYLIELIDPIVLAKLEKEFKVVNQIEDADIVITRNLRIDKSFIDKASNLKCIWRKYCTDHA